MANEKTKKRYAEILHYVADNIDSYVPNEWLLEGTVFTLRIPDRSSVPTVELDAEMPAIDLSHPRNDSVTTSVH